MMKIDSLVRVTKENSNGSSSTELEWEPGSKKEILKGAAAGAALGSIVPVIGTNWRSYWWDSRTDFWEI